MKISTSGIEVTNKEVKTGWKRVREFVKNNPGMGIMLTLLVAIIIISISGYLFIIKPLQKEKEQVYQKYQQLSASLLGATQPDQSSSQPSCISGKFPDNRKDWVIQQYENPDKEGFYCPRLRSDFLSPDIWYINSIPTDFKSLEFRYVVKNRDKESETFPTFIVSFGKNPTIFRLYLPLESNSQLVGFEKITTEDSKYDLEREEPKQLEKPIKEEVENELKIRIIIEQGNKVTFIFNPIYISAIKEEESISVEDSITYSFSLPHDPKPGSELSESEIGIGTIKGSCVKPISYKFCY